MKGCLFILCLVMAILSLMATTLFSPMILVALVFFVAGIIVLAIPSSKHVVYYPERWYYDYQRGQWRQF